MNITACGTSWHAGLAGKFMIERLARVPVEVDYASEWRYRDPIIGANHHHHGDLASGRNRRHQLPPSAKPKPEALRLWPSVNVVGSMITREAHAPSTPTPGRRCGVASTKAFTAQLTALYLFARTSAKSAAFSIRHEPRNWS